MYNFKLLPALLFAASVLTTPAPEVTSIDDMTGPMDMDSVYSLAMELEKSIPSSLQPALATAIPSTWVDKLLYNPDYLSTVLDDVRAGTYPYWYSDLPHAIKAEATTALQDYIDASATATATKDRDSAESTSGSDSTTASKSSPSQTFSAPESTAASGTPSASTSGSTIASDSASASTSQSTGGAPVATGGMAVSVAGAAGILAAALAL